MGDDGKIFVSVIPWAGLQQEIQIGKTIFWPWNGSEAQVASEKTRDMIQRYVSWFVDHHGKPVTTLAMCSYKGKEFQQLSDDEWSEMRGGRDALVFSVICPVVVQSIGRCSVGLCSAERFQVLPQELSSEDTKLYVQTGHNLTIGQFSVHRPLGVESAPIAQPNTDLVSAFNKALAIDFPVGLRTRLFRSLEWFRLAHVAADQVSEFSRIVMLATAFETLLEIPAKERDKSMFFTKEIEKRFRTERSILETREHNKKMHEHSKAAWWAYDFYKLRNAIVHGDDVDPARLRHNTHITQKDAADAVLYQIIFQILFRRNCFDSSSYLSHLLAKDQEDCLLSFEGFEETQQNLGWMEKAEE